MSSGNAEVEEPEVSVLVHFRIVSTTSQNLFNPSTHPRQEKSSSAILKVPMDATLANFTAAAVRAIDEDKFGIRSRAIHGLDRPSAFNLGELFVQLDIEDRLPAMWIKGDGALKDALKMMAARVWRDFFFFDVRV